MKLAEEMRNRFLKVDSLYISYNAHLQFLFY